MFKIVLEVPKPLLIFKKFCFFILFWLIAKLSDTEFRTLVIRVLTKMVEYGFKIEEKVKAMQSEIKENVQGRYSDKKETRTQINNLDQQEEINI